MEKILGKKITDAIFELVDLLNNLGLTDFEKIILLLLMITTFGNTDFFT